MNKRKNNGITLIALIVTIIILLILAGISISILAGENGLIKKAEEAKDSHETAEIEEQIYLAQMNLMTENKKITSKAIKEYLIENNIYEESEITIEEKDFNTDVINIRNASVELPTSRVTLYFQKDESWTENEVYVYVWYHDSEGTLYKYAEWPGTQAELVDGTTDIYRYSVPEEYQGKNIIFNNGDNKAQTDDLTMGVDGEIFKNSDSRKIYAKPIWNDMYIYMWNSETEEKQAEWPGEPMIDVKNSDGQIRHYEYTIPEKYDKFVITTKDKSPQTEDISFERGNVMYCIDKDNWQNDKLVGSYYMYSGKWSKYITE